MHRLTNEIALRRRNPTKAKERVMQSYKAAHSHALQEVNDGNLGISNHYFFMQGGRSEYVVERTRQRRMGTCSRRIAELLVQETGRNDGRQSCVANASTLSKSGVLGLPGTCSQSHCSMFDRFPRPEHAMRFWRAVESHLMRSCCFEIVKPGRC